MRPEGLSSTGGTDMEPAQSFTSISVPDLFPRSADSGQSVELDVPAELDIETAVGQWEASGGQVRTFSNGPNSGVRLKTYSLPEWLVKTQGARYRSRAIK
jgi:hypothetical protein